MPRALQKHLRPLAEGRKKQLAWLQLGPKLEAATGYTTRELLVLVVEHRLSLARSLLRSARTSLDGIHKSNRTAVSRAYYSMYHSARAMVFFDSGGDDHQDHSELPKHLPSDLPDRLEWEALLKHARLERNRADYDPYPRADRRFLEPARSLCSSAQEFLRLTRDFLNSKDWRA